ncbi:hypothetical protein AB0C34_17205 [Nocardia sp. NPDC049220]|uniref:hypothetical protein n=1 Tax=Nocardia sp. NPDC049220 TaxID=3155273 RepID=UPI0033C31F56
MLLPEIKRAPRLRAVPDLNDDHYEIHAGALTPSHIGRTIAIKTETAVIAGPLTSLCESRLEGRARLLLRVATGSTIGELTLGLHPAHPVTVLPADYALSVVARAQASDDE